MLSINGLKQFQEYRKKIIPLIDTIIITLGKQNTALEGIGIIYFYLKLTKILVKTMGGIFSRF